MSKTETAAHAPWRLGVELLCLIEGVQCVLQPIDEPGYGIVAYVDTDDLPETKANVAKVLAAPDQHEALLAFVAARTSKQLQAAVKLAEAAIAKAKGE